MVINVAAVQVLVSATLPSRWKTQRKLFNLPRRQSVPNQPQNLIRCDEQLCHGRARNLVSLFWSPLSNCMLLRQTDGGSNSEDEDFSPKGGSGKNKRVMANRQSAQRSRLRKLQYIQDLENNVARLQNEICQIQPQLNFLQEKYAGELAAVTRPTMVALALRKKSAACAGLSSQNHKLRDKVASLLNEARYKDSMNNSLREEIARIVTKTGKYLSSRCQVFVPAVRKSNIPECSAGGTQARQTP